MKECAASSTWDELLRNSVKISLTTPFSSVVQIQTQSAMVFGRSIIMEPPLRWNCCDCCDLDRVETIRYDLSYKTTIPEMRRHVPTPQGTATPHLLPIHTIQGSFVISLLELEKESRSSLEEK